MKQRVIDPKIFDRIFENDIIKVLFGWIKYFKR
jgi:hypothetical protein